MFTLDFFECNIEVILNILFIPVITLNIVYLACIIYSKYSDFAKAVVKVVISAILGFLCFPMMTLTLLYIFYIILVYPTTQQPPVPGVTTEGLVRLLLILLAIPISLCVSLVGSVLISIISGFTLHKFFK